MTKRVPRQDTNEEIQRATPSLTNQSPYPYGKPFLIVIVLDLEALELECGSFTTLRDFLVVHILDAGADVLSAANDRSVRVLILLGNQSQPVQKRGWYGPHRRVRPWPAEVQQPQPGDVDLIPRRRHHPMDRRLDEAFTEAAISCRAMESGKVGNIFLPLVKKVRVSAALHVIPPSTGFTYFH